MRKFVVGLVLMLAAACRSLPVDVYDANTVSNDESAAIIALWQIDVLPELRNADSTKNPEALSIELRKHVAEAFTARAIINEYLKSPRGDVDAAKGFEVASQLLYDIYFNIEQVLNSWNDWTDPNLPLNNNQFVSDMNEQIHKFNVLNDKFNEWVKQFKVK